MSVHFCPLHTIITLKTANYVVTVVRTWHFTDLRHVCFQAEYKKKDETLDGQTASGIVLWPL
jgi:hypothetical protein